jgi:hypothetical protein
MEILKLPQDGLQEKVPETGKSTENINIKSDLTELLSNDRTLTAATALDILIKKYQKKKFNTRLLWQFRIANQVVLQRINSVQYLIDPQDFISYAERKIRMISDKYYLTKLYQHCLVHGKGLIPGDLAVLKESLHPTIVLQEKMSEVWPELEKKFLTHISVLQDFAYTVPSEDFTSIFTAISKNPTCMATLKNLSRMHKMIIHHPKSTLTIATSPKGEFNFAYINWKSEQNNAILAQIFKEEISKFNKEKNTGQVANITELEDKTLNQIETLIFLNIALFRNKLEKFTNREIVAIYLHEVGHLINLRVGIAAFLRQFKGWYLLQILDKFSKDPNAFQPLFKKFEAFLSLRRKQVQSINLELSADEFAAKYGYYSELKSVLEKLQRMERTIMFRKGKVQSLVISYIVPDETKQRIRQLKVYE